MIIEMSGDTFPNNLIFLRKKYALSRRALAKLIGLPEITLVRIENGTCVPAMPAEAFMRTCEVFHIDPDSLAQTDLSIS